MSSAPRRNTRRSSALAQPPPAPEPHIPPEVAPSPNASSKPAKASRKRAASSTGGSKAKKQALGPDPVQDLPVQPAEVTRVTREGNDPHPGRTAGLNKRTQVEISAEAAEKQAAKDARAEEKEMERQAEKTLGDKGIMGMARLLDARRRMEREGSDEEEGEVEDVARQRASFMSSRRAASSTSVLDAVRAGVPFEPSTGVPGKKLTAAEKKRAETDLLHARVLAARAKPTTNSNAAAKTSSKEVAKTYTGGLDTNWQSRIAGLHLGAPSRASPASKLAHGRQREDEAVGGFTDADVAYDEPVSNGPQRQIKSRTIIVPGSPPPSRTRAAKTKINPEKSSAFINLPDWSKPHLGPNGAIIPTIIEIYGAQQNPWKMDLDEDTFLLIVQYTIDAVAPSQHYTLTRGDNVYRKARQDVYNWRASFYKAALSAVKAEIRMKQLRTSKAVADFVERGLHESGEAFWEYPDQNMPRGALRSKYILRSFAEHLKIVYRGSIASEVVNALQDVLPKEFVFGLPQGALTLAVCAVQRAYEAHKTGKYIAAEKFSYDNVKTIWSTHFANVTAGYVTKPKRFEQLILDASLHVDKAASSATQASSESQRPAALIIRDASSSPVPEDDN